MTAGWCFRTLRAAVFAAVCVLLAALGHVLMSGTAVPSWALAVAVAVTGGAAWCLAGRERGLLVVSSVVVAAQTALHVWFSYVQELSRPPVRPMPPMSMHGMAAGEGTSSMDHLASMAHMGHAMHSMTRGGRSGGSTDAMGAMSSLDAMPATGHALGAMSSTGMLAAHVLAALLCGLWLAHGDRAAFRILRAFAGWLAAPLRLPLTLPAPPHRPRIRVRRSRAARTPRRLLLVCTVTSRGPPAGTAVL
ncbi:MULTISPECIES: hypothetical protein [unclassified Streptomyces]|uniref:hypothetical protein n=1 Tax=unclassified Streptomyces TaxID=2593676 RepID=UPI000C87FA9C|nr:MULTISPECIES: hypothetical protein [unclassified Streptomyces]MBJ6643320.1 hypothetical protein [Streptomyces sp. BSE7-9]MCA2201097.1 hypothetical protein [Streptomyces sp. SMS_SU21]